IMTTASREGGRIINLSTSLTRVVAQTKATIYITSKGAINSLTLALAAELGTRKITVNAIAPGIVDTDMNSGWLNEGNARLEASNISVFSRVGTPDDISSLVGFLASDDSRWITGQVIDVSGGSCI
ncbi:SDR family oxidoreductase, partial [Xenorhabdus bovienii]|uniref:SDR family oxidoreductase n=1 Tax=Xenorhabdus bovienii TaxID=40576 RepID=UPI001EE0FF66